MSSNSQPTRGDFALRTPNSGAVNILLVDDVPQNLVALESILSDIGLNLVKVNSGEEALRCVLKQEFALILLDVQMPRMDGFETAELIRQRERSKHTPIVFVTATGKSDTFIFKGYSLGAVDYIVKPIVPEILKAKVKVFVDLFFMKQELQRNLQETSRLNRELEATNKELESFSYSVSHDLRVPLRAIDGFSLILLEEYPDKLDDEGKRLLNVVRNNTKKMGQLIDDLLAFSRIGRKELMKSELNMEEMVKEATEELKPAFSKGNVHLEIKSLPPAHGDKAMIHQVLINLLGNATKYTRPKESALIEVGGWQEEQENVYYVKDNGVGFDMQYVNKLFGIFQRLHNQEEFEGTGVGLALVQRIIHKHGGRVWAEGRVNEGATFFFTLPGKG